MIEKIAERIQLLKAEAEKSAAQHNALIGALQEAQNMYQLHMTEGKGEDSKDYQSTEASEDCATVV